MEFIGYEALEYNGMRLVYTKTLANQRPIINAIEGSKPCAEGKKNSDETCEQYDDRYYALTINKSAD